jgi:hypothetical protein
MYLYLALKVHSARRRIICRENTDKCEYKEISGRWCWIMIHFGKKRENLSNIAERSPKCHATTFYFSSLVPSLSQCLLRVNLSTGFGLDRSEYGVDSDRPTTLIMWTLENTSMTIRAGWQSKLKKRRLTFTSVMWVSRNLITSATPSIDIVSPRQSWNNWQRLSTPHAWILIQAHYPTWRKACISFFAILDYTLAKGRHIPFWLKGLPPMQSFSTENWSLSPASPHNQSRQQPPG